MATLQMIGFETGDGAESQSGISGTGSIVSSPVNSGGSVYAFRANPVTTATGLVTIVPLAADGTMTGTDFGSLTFTRFYFRYATKPSANDEPIFEMTLGSSLFEVRLNSSSNLAAYRGSGSTLMATGTTALSADTWYRIETRVETGTSKTWEVKINGVSEISGTATIDSITNASVATFGKGANRNGRTVDFFYDDILISSTAYPGAGACIALLPNANGNYQTWTIGAGAGSHYQNVNERPPDSDTTYLLSPLIINNLETEALTNSGTAGVSGTVNCVKSIGIFKADGIIGGPCQVVLRSGSTDNTTTDSTPSTSSYGALCKLYDTDPATSAAWVVSALDSVETGGKDTDATNRTRMTFTAAMVDFTAAAAFVGEDESGIGYVIRQVW